MLAFCRTNYFCTNADEMPCASSQDYLDALCSSYGSVITLAYYIAVPEDAPDPAAIIAVDIGIIKAKFDQ